eukprot:GAHX01001446.1.p1 GENE.GAHX01001446.1~~GAHX01001446.1.p1  ORF type:complete len:783 (+),score=157.02 GAHX01001446.1:1115-3463(+)
MRQSNRTMTITSYPTVSFTRIEPRENINRASIEDTSKNFNLRQESILKITKKPNAESLLLSKEDLEKHEKLFIKKNYINRSKLSLTRIKQTPFADLEKAYRALNTSELKDPLSLYTKLENYPDKLGMVKSYQTLEIKTNRILSDMFRSLFHPTPFKLIAFNDKMMEQLTLLECLVFSKTNNVQKLIRSNNDKSNDSFTSLYKKEKEYKKVKITLDILTEFEELSGLFKRVDFEVREEHLLEANKLVQEVDIKLDSLQCSIKLVENLKAKNNQKRNLIISLAEVKFFNSLFLEVGMLLEFDDKFVCGVTLFDIKELFVYLKRKHKTVQSKADVILHGFNERLSGLLNLVNIDETYKRDKHLCIISSFQTIIASNLFDSIISPEDLKRYSEESTLIITHEMPIDCYLEKSDKASFAVKILSEHVRKETILYEANGEVNSLLSLEDLIQIDLEKMIRSPDILIRNFCKTFAFLNVSFNFFASIKKNEFIAIAFVYSIIDKSYSDILNIITTFIDLLHGKKSYILLRLIQIVTCALNDLKDILIMHKLDFNINEKYEMLSLIFKSFILSIHVNNICDFKENLNTRENWSIASIKQIEHFGTILDSIGIDTQKLVAEKEKKLKLISSLDQLMPHLEFYFEVKKSVGYIKKNMPGCVNTLNKDVDKCIFDFFDLIVAVISAKVGSMDNKSKKQIKTTLIFIKTIDNIVYISDILKLNEGFISIDSLFYTKLGELRDKTINLVRSIVHEDTVRMSGQNEPVINEKKVKIYEKLLNTLLEEKDVLFITNK